MKAIIVTGSREWQDEEALFDAIDAERPDVIIHGDNPRGADAMVAKSSCILDRKTARERGSAFAYVSVIPMPAQWDKYGRAAGPKRNSAMLEVLLTLREHGYEVAVVAAPIPQGSGTQDMMEKARATDVRVRVVEPRPDEITCKDCEGAGTLIVHGDEQVQCKTCNGTGKIDSKVKCKHCGGIGRVEVGHAGHAPTIIGCWECNGTGKVKV